MLKSAVTQKILSLVILAVISSVATGCGSHATVMNPVMPKMQAPAFQVYNNRDSGEIIVKFRQINNSLLAQFNQRYGTKVVNIISALNTYVLQIPANKTVKEMVTLFSNDSLVEWAEENGTVTPIKKR